MLNLLTSSESCIKGHRSSSCKHSDRPLFEIKKKGRPVSQCEKCRELRQSKRMHSKCLCNLAEGVNIGPSSSQPPPPRKKSACFLRPEMSRALPDHSVLAAGRFVPITPSLPNGISDALFCFGSSSMTS